MGGGGDLDREGRMQGAKGNMSSRQGADMREMGGKWGMGVKGGKGGGHWEGSMLRGKGSITGG